MFAKVLNRIGLIALILLFSFISSQAQIRNIQIQQAEFYWDNDPGIGNATALQSLDDNFNQALEQLIASNIDVPTQGIHVLGLRVKDENGNWSSTFSKAIMVNPALSTRNIRIQLGEYFWDNDPGQGSGNTLVAIDSDFNQAIEQGFESNMVFPSSGNRVFNIRFKDENGNWGQVFKQTILVHDGVPQRNPTVQQAEFYWDNDPGIGNATALQSLDGNFNQALEQLIASNIDVPTQGIHVLGLRVKDENGNWSSTFSKAIMVNPALSTRNIRIQLGEYFWDNDPGQGSGNTLVAIDGDFNQAIEQGFESNMVFPSSGNRVFNIRFKDENGNWGQVFKQTILVHDGVPQRNPTVQQAEFYWDNDPGVGNATALQSLDGNFNQALEQLIASNIDVPTQGIHVLGLRVKDENGNWSSTFSKAIMVNPALSTRNIRIQLGEYFWDNDPGQGSGNTLVAIDGGFNQAIEQGFESNMVFPSSGNRVFNIRFKDENGNWGQVFKQTILVHDGVPQRNPTVQQAEFYWDNDPGVGNATALQSLDGNFNQALEQLIASNIDVPTQGIHVLGLRVKDENGNWSSTFSKAIMVNPALSTHKKHKNTVGRVLLGQRPWSRLR